MTRFTKLAVTIALGLQSLGAIATSGQSDKFTKGQFTSLVESIPDDNVRDIVAMLYQDEKYDELESTLLEYIDGYLENSVITQDRAVIEDKKNAVMGKIGDFIADEARESEEANLESMEDLLGDLLNDLVRKSDRSQTESTEDMESSFEDLPDEEYENEPMTVDSARQIVQEAIETLDDDVKTKAISLLSEKKYHYLEDLIMAHIDDMENVDDMKVIDALIMLITLDDAQFEDFEDLPDEEYENEPMTVDSARQIVQEAIETLDDDVKTKAISLLSEKKYHYLEDLIMTHIDDMENVDDMKVIDALIMLITLDDAESEDFEDSPDEDSMSVDDAKELEEANAPEDQFEDSLNSMVSPERMFEGEMTEDQAIAVVEGAIDKLDDDTKTEATTLLGDENYIELEELFMNNIGADSDINGRELFEALSFLVGATGSSEDNSMVSPERMFEGEMTEDQAKAVVEGAIDKLDNDTKTEATSLLGEENYMELEELFMSNIGADSDINGRELLEALSFLEGETGSLNEHEVDEEKQLSELKETLATTQEELKELLSRINNV